MADVAARIGANLGGDAGGKLRRGGGPSDGASAAVTQVTVIFRSRDQRNALHGTAGNGI